MNPLGADSSAGVETVDVAPFRTTEVDTVFERIMRWSFRSILGGDVDAWRNAGDTNNVDAVDRAVAGQGDRGPSRAGEDGAGRQGQCACTRTGLLEQHEDG